MKMSATNIATQYLLQNNETVDDWSGYCGELANAISRPEDDIIYVEGDAVWCNTGWSYHMVLLREGLIHDAWCEGDALSPQDWLTKMFGTRLYIEVSLNGETIFSGPVHGFKQRWSVVLEKL